VKRALFAGSRDWTDEAPVRAVIDALPTDAVVIHGAARGLDAIVDRLARGRGLAVEAYPADWNRHGKGAGPIRNQRMIDEGHPTEGYAFPLSSSKGTWDMVRRLRAAGVPTTIHTAVSR